MPFGGRRSNDFSVRKLRKGLLESDLGYCLSIPFVHFPQELKTSGSRNNASLIREQCLRKGPLFIPTLEKDSTSIVS
jgi:hypothetical protein